MLTLGIEPTRPETGYGYIHFGELYRKIDNDDIFWVKNFTEKPDKETAKRFLDEGTYLWNSGMFIWKVETILKNIKKYMPDLNKSLQQINKVLDTDLEEKVI